MSEWTQQRSVAEIGNIAPRAYSGNAIFLKRVFDIAFCLAICPILLIFGLPISLLIILNGGSPFYSQRRVGRNGAEFQCLKFRTMVVDADRKLKALLDADPAARAEWEETFKLKYDPRITWIGKFLRKTSLDELPQVLNVLRGEMSLVGPRPIVKQELERYGDFASTYLACLPGLTGLWQISGRNDVSYAARVAYDVNYAEDWTLFLDMKIIFLTIPIVLFRKGAY